MTRPLLVIVSGPPGAGKTTLAKRLGAETKLPALCRDDIKDSIFDSLGWSDRAWSRKVGVAAWELLYMLAERLLASGTSVIVESNFERNFAHERFLALFRAHPFDVVEIHCSADAEVLNRRFWERQRFGARHPGHNPEGANEASFRSALAERKFEPVAVDDRVVEVDTTDFERIDWERIVSTVRRAMGEADGSQDR